MKRNKVLITLPIVVAALLCTMGAYTNSMAKYIHTNICAELSVIAQWPVIVEANGDRLDIVQSKDGEVIGGIELYKGKYVNSAFAANISKELENALVGMACELQEIPKENISVSMIGTGQYGRGNIEMELLDLGGNETIHNFFQCNSGEIYDIWIAEKYERKLSFLYTNLNS